MSTTDDRFEPVEEYVFGVRVLAARGDGDRPYRFDAPQHEPVAFESREDATLYADVYFDVNGFAEAGTGDRGVPPAVVQAGKDTLAAYMRTMPNADRDWVASFFGVEPGTVERYAERVRSRASEIRTRAARAEDGGLCGDP